MSVLCFTLVLLLTIIASSLMVGAAASPALVSPADKSYTNDNTPLLDWAKSSGATKYHLQLAIDSGFSSIIIEDNNIIPTEYTVLSSISDRAYYWRVRAFEGFSWSGWSEEWEFVVDTVVPAAPTLLSPIDGNYINDPTPLFDWSSVSGASEYDFQFDDESDMSSSFNVKVGDSHYQYTSTLSDQPYYWRVRTWDAAGNYGSWTSIESFTVDTVAPAAPTLTSPTNGAFSTSQTVDFYWSSVSGASQYTWERSDTVTFDIVRSTATFGGTSLQAVLGSDGIHYWRVKALDSAGNIGSWSSVWSITVDTVPPGIPTLLSPADNGYTSDSTPALDWNDATDAYRYQIYMDDNIDFLSRVLTHETDDSYLAETPPTLSDGVYYWKVRAYDHAFNWGSWSSVWSFTVDTIAPAAPTLLTPIDGLTDNDNTPYFNWNIVVDGVEYQIQIDITDSFLSTLVDTLVVENEYNHTSALGDGLHYWRVRAKDAAGNWGSWSASRTFTIDTTGPDAPSLVSPSHGETLTTDNTPMMLWDVSVGAVEYEILIDNDLDFLSPNVAATSDNPFYNVDTALDNALYYWKVRARDALGNWGSWSSVQIFSIDIPVITEFSKSIPWLMLILLPISLVMVKGKKRTSKI